MAGLVNTGAAGNGSGLASALTNLDKGFGTLGGVISAAVEGFNQGSNGLSKGLLATTAALNYLSKQVGSGVDDYVKSFEKISYGLSGSATTQHELSNTLLKTLGSSGVVSLKDVMAKVSTYLSQGIVSDVESRAYIATIAADIGSSYSAYESSLNTLSRAFAETMNDNGLAIETSLKSFLTEEYNNFEYISSQFASTLQNLTQAQMTMSATAGMDFASVVEKWMGVLYSNGASDSLTSNLSQALGYLGSGNINQLTSNAMNPLLIQGANAAGLSYADLLFNLDAEKTNTLMQGIVSVISGFGDETSKVVRSELGRIFGITVQDIKAASTVYTEQADKWAKVSAVNITDNITENLLSHMSDYLATSNVVSNLGDNLLYSMGVDIANDSLSYLTYKISQGISNVAGAISGTTATLVSMVSGAISIVGGIGSLVSNVWSIGKKLVNNGTVVDAIGEYEALGGYSGSDANQLKAYSLGGNGITSGGGNGNSTTVSLNTGKNLYSDDTNGSGSSSTPTVKGTSDTPTLDSSDAQALYNLIYSLPLAEYTGNVMINHEQNEVKLEREGVAEEIMNSMLATALYTRDIFDLLSKYINGSTSTTTAEYSNYIDAIKADANWNYQG